MIFLITVFHSFRSLQGFYGDLCKQGQSNLIAISLGDYGNKKLHNQQQILKFYSSNFFEAFLNYHKLTDDLIEFLQFCFLGGYIGASRNRN